MFKSQQEIANSGSLLIPKLNPLATGRFQLSEKKKKRLIILGVIVLPVLIMLLVIGTLGYQIYSKARATVSAAQKLDSAVGEQNLDKIKKELKNTKDSVNELSDAYSRISWLKEAPFFGVYVKDGQSVIKAGVAGLEAGDLVIKTIEPYADIIGLQSDSASAQNAAETTQDRLDFIIKTLPSLLPAMDELGQKVTVIKSEIDQINPDNYPEDFMGKKVRSKLEEGKTLIDIGVDLVIRGKPLLEASEYLLGVDSSRTYLILFQNDKELRPTGGFITAYSIAKVEKGRFEPVSSSDIYNLDDLYTPTLPASEPLIKYIRGPYTLLPKYRLRDINWSPDFSVSMSLFLTEASSAGIKDIDGVIGVDTQLLVNILDVLGPIGVPGFGEFSTKNEPKCNCPQVIYELESFADNEGPIVWSENEPGKIVFAPANYDNRKKIIGPLMNSILANTLGQSKDKLPALFTAIFSSVLEKHVLVYVADEEAESAVKAFGIAGTIDDYQGDYLSINDANLGGRKSNLYVTQEVDQEVKISADGSVEKTVTITYKNPAAYDGWLNSVLPNWVRIYVPKGSQLINFEGLEEKESPYEDLGKTVFAGYFELRPQGIAKVKVTYTLPFKVKDDYSLFIQKQPGTDAPLYTISAGKNSQEFSLKEDKELKFKI